MSKLNSKNAESFHPILPEVFSSEAITFDLSKFKERSPPKVFATNVFDFYKIFHNICYFFYVMPFKIMHGTEDDNPEIQFQESKCQRGIVITLHLAHFFYALPPILGYLQGGQIHIDPSQFYSLLQSITGYLMVITFSVVCMRQSRLKSFLTKSFQFQKHPTAQHNRSKIIYQLVLIIPLSLILGSLISYLRSSFNFSSWTNFAESGAQEIVKYVQFWDTPSTAEVLSQNSTTPEMSTVEVFCKLGATFIHTLLIIYSYTLAILLEVLVFIMCFTVCQIGWDFWSAIEVESINLAKLRQCYKEMKSLMDELNWTFGYLMLVFMLAAIPYYGVHIIEIFNGTWFQRIETIYFMLLYSIALLLAAEGHHKFQQLPQFVFDNYKQLGTGSHEDLSIFVKEVTTSKSEIGFKGLGFFVVSYGFLGNILGLVLTHVIIMLQFKTSQKC